MAEVLLRKTTAKQVESLYEIFLARFPNPEALAHASKSELIEALRPLGMEHKRAVLLKKLGMELKEKYNGKVPESVDELMKLPGVGRYAASSVMCLAYGKDVAMVDTNTIRVIARVFGFKSAKARPKNDSSLWSFVEALIPAGKAREFNLAILDFGNKVCTARNPKCTECVLRDLCKYKSSLAV
jgi:A/G-specific adenine glycosylase